MGFLFGSCFFMDSCWGEMNRQREIWRRASSCFTVFFPFLFCLVSFGWGGFVSTVNGFRAWTIERLVLGEYMRGSGLMQGVVESGGGLVFVFSF